jgi:hypothetical protein
MPDQSSAASEHAILQEITAPLARLPDDSLPVAADVDFPIVLRGYDRVAVNAYVKKTSQLVAELQATRSPEAAIRRALERVGEQISGILQRAHETAEEITSQSRAEAEERLERARAEADQITAGARGQLKDLDADTDKIWAERHRIVSDARELARQLMELADAAAERFPPAEEPEPAHPQPFDAEAPEVGDVEAPEDRDVEAPEDGDAEASQDGDVEAPGDGDARALEEEGAEAEVDAARPEEVDPADGSESVDDRAQTIVMPPLRPPDPPPEGR